ncbi:hypothetical protein [uncultured Photobacterium sp.]|nr:hypothetical protein [uncultured Photobacterium sp.]
MEFGTLGWFGVGAPYARRYGLKAQVTRLSLKGLWVKLSGYQADLLRRYN